jgi:hypothetical protein
VSGETFLPKQGRSSKYFTGGNMESQINPTPQKRDTASPILLLFILLVLSGILLIQIYGLFTKSSLNPGCTAAIDRASILLDTQSTLISSNMNDYENAVYNSSSVDTIYQQTFLANEYQFVTLNWIAMQNAALLEITTNCK